MQSVTGVGKPRSADLTKRQIQYAVAMTIRLLCFIGAVLLPFGIYTWVLIVGAVVLPYVAVILANAVAPPAKEQEPVRPEHPVISIAQPVRHELPTRDKHPK